jgi:predicted pyridoxine 5'-phosphate oxidase superfamily flavin-nucleotide-binding protein
MTIDTAHSPSPWHEGERLVQERVGTAERMARVGSRAIRDFMPDQHRDFFAQLPFLVIGSVDDAGRPWASLLSGKPGFVRSPDPRRLVVKAQPVDGDKLQAALLPGARLGILGIELPTRRRNRMNGRITAVGHGGFVMTVDQSFGNCPQYIQRRDYVALTAPRPTFVQPATTTDAEVRTLIGHADTVFVATAAQKRPDATHGVDVSHRGGRPGFVGLAADGSISVPDYLGNRYFNTLGNMTRNPRAGLLIIDFARGDLLQITGTTEILWDGPEVHAFKGAERLWRLRPTEAQWLRGGWRLQLEGPEISPQSVTTGTWEEAQAALAGER